MPRKVTKSAKAKPTRNVSKSDMIRDMATAYPEAGPTEIATKIKSLYNAKVSPAMVSTVLSQDRARGRNSTPARRGRPIVARDVAPIKVRTLDGAMDIPADIQNEKPNLAATDREIMAKLQGSFFNNLRTQAHTPSLFNRVCVHRRERAMELLMQAASAAGGIDELSKLFDGLKVLIAPQMPSKQKSA